MLTASLTRALGIASTTTIFSIVDAVFIRPLPYSHPDRLYVIREALPRFDEPVWSRAGAHSQHECI